MSWMSLVDNYNDIAFASQFPIDKIAYESEVLSYTQGASSGTTRTLTNEYGRKCFISLIWSTDQTNWYPAQAYVTLTNTYTVNGWVDASTVYIRTENNSGSSITFYVKYVLDTIE